MEDEYVDQIENESPTNYQPLTPPPTPSSLERGRRVDVIQHNETQHLRWGPVEDSDTVTFTLPDLSTVTVLCYITEGIDALARKAATLDGRLKAGMGDNTSGNRAERRAKEKAKAGAESNYEMEMYFDQGKFTNILLVNMIKAWSFKNSIGQPFPISPQTVARLPTHTRDFIVDKIDEMNPKYDLPLPEELDVEPDYDQNGHRKGPLEERMTVSSLQ